MSSGLAFVRARAVGRLIGSGLPCSPAAGTAGRVGVVFAGGSASPLASRTGPLVADTLLVVAAGASLGGGGRRSDGSLSSAAQAGRISKPAPASHRAVRRIPFAVATPASYNQGARIP